MRSRPLLSLILGISLLSIGCGRKEPAAPLRFSGSAATAESFSLSPSGVASTQKIFNLYSKDGKLSSVEITNLGQKISPQLANYLKTSDSVLPADARYSAQDLFSLLGESNRVIALATKYDLTRCSGWESAFRQEFPESSEGVRAEVTKFICAHLVGGTKDKEAVQRLKNLMKIGLAFNLVESVRLAKGSLGLNLVRHIWLSYARGNEDLDMSDDSLALIKMLLVVQYVLDGSADSTKAKTFAQKSRPSSEFMDKVLEDFGAAIKGLYPKIDTGILSHLYRENFDRAQVELPDSKRSKASGTFLFPLASARATEGTLAAKDKGVSAAALWALEYSAATCPKFTAKVSLSKWESYIVDEVLTKNLNLFSTEYCSRIEAFTTSPEDKRSRNP